MPLVIAALSDVHSPRYVSLLTASINNFVSRGVEVDLVLLAGDLVDKNNYAYLHIVLKVIEKLRNIHGEIPPILAVFGNEEYQGYEDRYRKLYPHVTWIDDEIRSLNINGVDLCIVGSRGVLMKPTVWQQRNIPNIESVYRARVSRIKEMLRVCRGKGFTILVTHYASTLATLEGEDPRIHPFLGYPILEKLNDNEKPSLAIHGHVHNSVKIYAKVNSVSVYNVSLPAAKSVTVINIDPGFR
jgi:Icc-related predicted phosphoesterase